MNEELKYIIGMLNSELFYDGPKIAYNQIYRPTQKFKELHPGYPEMIRSEFSKLLSSQDLSLDEYFRITDISFESEDSLYRYLGRVYEYLFEGKYQDDPPYPPADDDDS